MFALDIHEWRDLKEIVDDCFNEIDCSKLKIKWDGGNTVKDAEFGHVLVADPRFVEVPYTQILSTALKLPEPSGADFEARQYGRIYIPSSAIQEKLPGGVLKREAYVFEINEVDYRIEAIVPFPQQFGDSMVHRCYITEDRPPEQPQGVYGGG